MQQTELATAWAVLALDTVVLFAIDQYWFPRLQQIIANSVLWRL